MFVKTTKFKCFFISVFTPWNFFFTSCIGTETVTSNYGNMAGVLTAACNDYFARQVSLKINMTSYYSTVCGLK